MEKRVKNRIRVEVLFPPEEIAHIDLCAKLAQVKRVELIRRLGRRAYADAVLCNLIKEADDGQSSQSAA